MGENTYLKNYNTNTNNNISIKMKNKKPQIGVLWRPSFLSKGLTEKLDPHRDSITKCVAMLTTMSLFSFMCEVLHRRSLGQSASLTNQNPFHSQSCCSITLKLVTNALLHHSLNRPLRSDGGSASTLVTSSQK